MDADVTGFAPSGTPRVADNPVSGSVTDSLDAVIDVVVAHRQDTTSVGLEVSGGEADRRRTTVQSDSEVAFTSGDGGVATDSGNEGRRVGLASASLTSCARHVWVSRFSLDTTGLDNIVEGMLGPTTLATIRSGVARGDLLRSEGLKGISTNELAIRFNGSGGAEGPAGTALSLILDRGDNTVVAPVNVVGDRTIEGRVNGFLTRARAVVQVLSLKFSRGQVRKLSDTKNRFAVDEHVLTVQF